ncbi:MAG: transcriptional repressor NrdR [Clostridia bacterium]|nr:transcriptional repressor NrdR [Clostridia bacterium]
MRCPVCGCCQDKVLDTRPIDEERSIRRRRECLNCQHRFTSYETVERGSITVCKRDNSREAFDRDKLMGGIKKACLKRPVTDDQMNDLVDSIESEFKTSMRVEVSTLEIGERVMAKLREIDDVAYIRFASVYREFPDADAFMDELNSLKQLKEEKAKKALKNK